MLLCHQPYSNDSGIQVITPFPETEICCALHDIDGTHSRIREWVPVMTLVTGCVAKYGMFSGNTDEIAGEIRKHREESFPEAHKFAIESAGLSALTQMEWALRMARRINGSSDDRNEAIIKAIWQGEELFDNAGESPAQQQKMVEQASKLFKAYEILLLEMGRDANLAAAAEDPEAWRIPGSMDFLSYLKEHGVLNYFVTGAVVEYDESGTLRGTMYEEIQTLGYPVGHGKLIEDLCGSTWKEKLPKLEIMRRLCRKLGVDPRHVLVVGDGRSEIAAGRILNCVTLSRLNIDALRAREIHTQLQTNMIVTDYCNLAEKIFSSER